MEKKGLFDRDSHNLKCGTNNTLKKITLAGSSIQLPFFFPSISSVKTNLDPLEYLKIIVKSGYPGFLISAYDINNSNEKKKRQILELLEKASDNKQIILLDSGNYESFWFRNRKWSENKFIEILKTVTFNISFCFDCLEPPDNLKEIVSTIEERVLYEQSIAECGSIVPIIHAPKKLLIEAIVEVAKRLQPILIAIPERILGDGILERAKTLTQIRKALDSIDFYYPLHLLGTGNSLSILIYTICGADSFDGLEWCQTTVDHKTGLHYHFQQRELFEIPSTICSLKNDVYSLATLVQNLTFYVSWMSEIQREIQCNGLKESLMKYFPKTFIRRLKDEIPEIFLK